MRNRFHAIIMSIVMLSFQSMGHAQGLQYPPKQHPPKSFASTVGGDILHVFSSPFRFRQGDGLKFLALTAVTTVFITSLDERIDDNFIERDDFLVKPAIGLAKIGDGYDKISAQYVLACLSVSMLTGGLVLKDKKLLQTTRLLIESFFIANGITYIGKRVFGRARPFTGEGPVEFEPLNFNARYEQRSFPSGHATSAFAMMTVLAKQYNQWWVKIPAYTIAVSVALQRLDNHSHWSADVIVGGAVGYSVASMLVNRYKQESQHSPVSAYIFGNRAGVVVAF